jgi:histidyl-tRNA synthetase
MGDSELAYILPIASKLREAGVSVEIYPDSSKIKKQFDYAQRKAIPFLSITGSSEAEAGVINVKNLATGEQKSFSCNDIASIVEFCR